MPELTDLRSDVCSLQPLWNSNNASGGCCMIIFFWHCHAVSGPPGGVSRVKSGLRGRWDRPVVRVLRREVMYCKTTSKPHAKLRRPSRRRRYLHREKCAEVFGFVSETLVPVPNWDQFTLQLSQKFCFDRLTPRIPPLLLSAATYFHQPAG